jgi:hypothetical protein
MYILVIRLGTGQPRNLGSVLRRIKKFIVFRSALTELGAEPVSYFSTPGLKQPERHSDHLTHFSARVKNNWSWASLLHIIFQDNERQHFFIYHQNIQTDRF